MGYCTDYTLQYKEYDHNPYRANIYSQLHSAFRKLESGYELQQLVEYGELIDVKWYDHVEHMKIISGQFPKVLFTLSKMGQDGEQSRVYFENGKAHAVESIVTFPPFDRAKLK